MAVIVRSIIGFELGPLAPPSGTTLGYFEPSGFVDTDITAGSKRNGTYGFNAAVSSGANKSANVRLTTANTALPSGVWELRIRYFFRPVTFPDANNLVISWFGSGFIAFEFQLQMNTTGQLRAVPSFCGNTTTAYEGSFSVNTWYQVRMRVFGEGSGGQVGAGKSSAHEVDVLSEDGTSVIASFSEALPNGNNMPSVWPALFAFGQSAAGGSGPTCTREIHYDDYWGYLATGSEVAAMEWPKGTKVEIYKPTANGTTNNFARGGVDTGANWSQVSDIPRATGGSATNVNSATAGQVDEYQHANLTTADDVVYHIQNVCWLLDSTTPQQLSIGADLSNVTTNTGGSANYALAEKAYTNATAITAATFNALQFGIKKLSGGTTLSSEQQFLEVLTGPPLTFTDDITFAASADFSTEGNPLIEVTDLTLTTGTLGFRLGNQGVEINVPETWQVNRIDVGYRNEETS